MPLSARATQKLAFMKGINIFEAENGSGKTTLADLIERDICSDAHEQRYRDLSSKRWSKDAYVRGTWMFNNEEVQIKQDLTDAGTRTRVNSQSTRDKGMIKSEYSGFLRKQTGLTLTEFQDIYHGIYYKRENDNLLLGGSEEEIQNIFETVSKLVAVGDKETLRLKQEIGDLKKRRKEMSKQLDKLQDAEEEMRQFLKRLGKAELTEELLKKQMGTVQEEIDRKQAHVSKRQAEQHAIDKEERTLRDQRGIIEQERRKHFEEVERVRYNQRELQSKIETLKKTQQSMLRMGPTRYDTALSYIKSKPTCQICKTDLLNAWDGRMTTGCPSCGTTWERIPRAISEAMKEGPAANKTVDTSEIDAEIKQVQEWLKKVNEELESVEVHLKDADVKMKELRSREDEHAARRRNIQKEVNDIIKEIQRDTHSLGELGAKIEMLSKQGDLITITKLREQKEDDLQKLIKEMREKENSLPEKDEIIDILAHFSRSFSTAFGYDIILNPTQKMVSVSIDSSTRSFDSLSWGERYFVDISLRIAIWMYLIERGLATHGMVLVDSPEAALDERRLDMLAGMLRHYQDDIMFIVTTRTTDFAAKLEGHKLQAVKTVQTSLFDFVDSKT